jgi:hypothetical protein
MDALAKVVGCSSDEDRRTLQLSTMTAPAGLSSQATKQCNLRIASARSPQQILNIVERVSRGWLRSCS